MSRAKLFVENFFVYGFINVLNKIIPLVLLPVITRMLPNTADFGKFDMFNLIMNFGSQIAILGMYDAMFREYFEKEDQQYRYNVTTTAQRIVFINSIFISALLIIFSHFFSNLFFGTTSNHLIVVFAGIGIILVSNQNIFQVPTRIQNKRKIFVFSGLLNSGIYYFLSILLIIVGLNYKALIYSRLISFLVLIIFFWLLNKKYFLKGQYNKKISKELMKIGLPLVPTFLVYWIFNSMDRLMITNSLGAEALGIYSIGARLASVSQFIYTAFAGGYSYFKYTTMKDTDQVQMNSNLFEYLSAISFVSYFIILPFNQHLFNFMFEGNYTKGSLVFPYLFLSPLLLMLFQILASQFILVKKSYISTLILFFGAVANVVLNYFLISIYGIQGAAVSTLIGYLVSLFWVIIISKKSNLFFINGKIIILYLLLFVEFIALYFNLQLIYINGVLIISIIMIYKNLLIKILKKTEHKGK